jgi:ornithine cyclodeaminase
MPAYLGGRFGTTGVKWYGSNLQNREKGLPRSIHMFTLNDSDTGAPLAVMSANLLSAYRTGAIPGVAVKHLAREDARVFGIVGPGVIGRVVTEATLTLRPGIDRLVVKGVDDADVQRYAEYIRPRFPQVSSIEAAETVEQVARESDIMTVTATRTTRVPVHCARMGQARRPAALARGSPARRSPCHLGSCQARGRLGATL